MKNFDLIYLFYSAAYFEPVSNIFILYQLIKVHVSICQTTLRYYCVLKLFTVHLMLKGNVFCHSFTLLSVTGFA